ncbi:MAG: DUF3667 domain-containing protein [Parafilimonas sp.]
MGRFCCVCGQENIEPRETFLQLISHFVYDLFHYDGKFFLTLKTLLLKPGLLTHEYVHGRRASYLHPIRMYVFTSAIFFIIFISYIAGGKVNDNNLSNLNAEQRSAINQSINHLKDSITKTNDPEKKAALQQSINTLEKIPFIFKQDSTRNTQNSGNGFIEIDLSNHSDNFLVDGMPGTMREYEQKQAKLSPDKKDGWFKRTISTKLIGINEKYRYNTKAFTDGLTERFFHSFPTMMFVSLPIVALLLQLLYINKRKKFTYVQHGVFTIHIYIAVYIFILIIYAFNALQNITHWQLFGWFSNITILGTFFYIERAMRNFYEQGKATTILKFIILLLLYSILLSLLMILFFMTSLIQI